jgi:hypothetical protein
MLDQVKFLLLLLQNQQFQVLKLAAIKLLQVGHQLQHLATKRRYARTETLTGKPRHRRLTLESMLSKRATVFGLSLRRTSQPVSRLLSTGTKS